MLTDAFLPDYRSLTERFVTTFKPVIFDDHVKVNGVNLYFEPEKVQVSVKEEVHALHGYFDGTEIVYCIDFELKPGLDKIEFAFKMEE